MQIDTNNACQLALEYWDKRQKWFCLKKTGIFLCYLYQDSWRYANFQYRFPKWKITWINIRRVILAMFNCWQCSAQSEGNHELLIFLNGETVLWCYGEIVLWWNVEIVLWCYGEMLKQWPFVKVKWWNKLVQ